MDSFYTATNIFAIFIFSLSGVLTPGPNNIMILTSSLNFGYKKTLPHMFGVGIGFSLMVAGVGFGVVHIFQTFPIVANILKILSVLYLFFMSYKIATNKNTYQLSNNNSKNKPFTFFQICAFQWVNPKAWVLAISALSIFTNINEVSNNIYQILIIAFMYLISSVVSTNTWSLGGLYLKKIIKNEKQLRIFNISMALLLIASIAPFIF